MEPKQSNDLWGSRCHSPFPPLRLPAPRKKPAISGERNLCDAAEQKQHQKGALQAEEAAASLQAATQTLPSLHLHKANASFLRGHEGRPASPRKPGLLRKPLGSSCWDPALTATINSSSRQGRLGVCSLAKTVRQVVSRSHCKLQLAKALRNELLWGSPGRVGKLRPGRLTATSRRAACEPQDWAPLLDSSTLGSFYHLLSWQERELGSSPLLF